jgi:hypothetical protein
MFKLRPQFPRYTCTYDPDIVLNHYDSLPENRFLLLEELTKKLTLLLALLHATRTQTLQHINVDYIHFNKENNYVCIYIPSILKSTTPTFHQKPLELSAFPENVKLCPVNCLNEYLNRTELIRENLPKKTTEKNNPRLLLLSYRHPHLPVGQSTIARYCRSALEQCGIDIKTFSAHSTRHSSTSKAEGLGVTTKELCRAAGWRSDSSFRRHYKMPLKGKRMSDTLLRQSIPTNN